MHFFFVLSSDTAWLPRTTVFCRSSLFAAHLFGQPRHRSLATRFRRGTRGAPARSGGGGTAVHLGGSCCEASLGSTWGGSATRPACSSSTDSSSLSARPGALAGKSRERRRRRRRRRRSTSPWRAALAHCVPPPGSGRHFRRGTPLRVA